MTGAGKSLLLLIILLALAPLSVFANAGTPLIWVAAAHLIIGNAVIGAGEGMLLSRWFRAPLGRCQWWMVAANYASMWTGAWLLGGIADRWYYFDLESAWGWMWALVGAAFLLTILVELPFVFMAIGPVGKRFWKSVGGNLAIQTASYVLAFGIYLAVGNISALRNLQVTPLAEMNAPANVVVYCMPTDLEGVAAGSLVDGSFMQVTTLPSEGRVDRLAVESTNGAWNLMAVGRERGMWRLMTNMTGVAVEARPVRVTSMNFGRAPELPGAEAGDWEYVTGFWPATGVVAVNRRTAERRPFALETPFVGWRARNATVLPDGKLLFQFGDDQICLLDAERRKIALVVRGRGPVAVVEPEGE